MKKILLLILALSLLGYAVYNLWLLQVNNNFKESNTLIKNISVNAGKKPSFSIYLKNNTTEQEINILREELNKIPQIAGIKYISREEAYKIYKEMNKDEPELLEFVEVGLLPASLEVYLNDNTQIKSIKNKISNYFFIDEIIIYPYSNKN